MKKILFVLYISILLLSIGCADVRYEPTNSDNQVSNTTSDVFCSGDELLITSEDGVSEAENSSQDIELKISCYDDFYKQFPEFHGKWEICEFCAHARLFTKTTEYVMDNAEGEILEFSEDGILLFDLCYSQSPYYNSMISMCNKNEICIDGGYLEHEKVPLSEDTSYLYFSLLIYAPELKYSDEKALFAIEFCQINDDEIFIGFDDVFFVAKRISA